jgi:hypothetical protein
MSATAPIRARLEAIACDGYGVTRTIATGRFARVPEDAPDALPLDASERRVRAACGVPRAPDGVVNNPLDGFALYAIPVDFTVAYVRTNAGGDWAEGLTEQHGPGTLDVVRDRAGTDAHDLLVALTWLENWAGLDPFLIDVGPAGEPSFDEEGQRVVMHLPLVATVRASVPGSYAP